MAVPAAAPQLGGTLGVQGRALRDGSVRDGMLWVLAGVYALAFFALGVWRYAAHRNFVDMGIFAQTAANAFGCFCNPIEGSHWAFHFSPILYIAGAVMRFWHSAVALVLMQAVAGALTAPPIYGIVRRRADRKTALMAAIVVLLYPPLAGATFNDFHENGLAPAAIAWLVWAFDGGSVALTLLLAAVALAIKEDQALFLAAGGAIGAVLYRRDQARMRLCGGIAFAGAIVFTTYFAFIQPHAAANPAWVPARFYAWTPGDWQTLPPGLLQRLGFLLLAFVPLLFIPFRSAALLLAILPLGEVLASRMPTTFTMGSHYAGAWTGYVFFAFALAIAKMASPDVHRAHRALYWCIGLCIVEFAAADPLHPGYFLQPIQGRDARLDHFLQSLPPAIQVATQEEAYSHLAATDPNAALLPERPGISVRACYILVDEEFPESVRLKESRWFVSAMQSYGTYVVVRRDGGIKLLRSRSCAASATSAPPRP